MRVFFNVFIVIFLLAIFTNSSSVCAYENFVQNTSLQYIASTKTETTVINNKEEHYTFQNRSRYKIKNSLSKNNNFGFAKFNSKNINYNIACVFITSDNLYPIYISNNIFSNLEFVILTRAP